jgi:hypothetical protein
MKAFEAQWLLNVTLASQYKGFALFPQSRYNVSTGMFLSPGIYKA